MNPEKQSRFIRLVLLTAAVLLAAFGLYFLFVRFGIGFVCIFNKITTLKCPGCGNTHAVDALLHFRFHEAFRFNYLLPVALFYMAWVYAVSAVSYIKKGKFHYISPFRTLDIAVLAALIVWFVVRNIFHF